MFDEDGEMFTFGELDTKAQENAIEQIADSTDFQEYISDIIANDIEQISEVLNSTHMFIHTIEIDSYDIIKVKIELNDTWLDEFYGYGTTPYESIPHIQGVGEYPSESIVDVWNDNYDKLNGLYQKALNSKNEDDFVKAKEFVDEIIGEIEQEIIIGLRGDLELDQNTEFIREQLEDSDYYLFYENGDKVD